MAQINIKNTPFDDNWSYKINLVGVCYLFGDKLENHYVIFSHGKYYDVYSDSDGVIEIKDFANFSLQEYHVSSFYLCKNKELMPIEYNDFIRTKFGSEIEEKYFQIFGKKMDRTKFVFFKNALFAKTYEKIENIIIDFVFGFSISHESFDLCQVDGKTFVNTIGGA